LILQYPLSEVNVSVVTPALQVACLPCFAVTECRK
jgi:hypothetical protein